MPTTSAVPSADPSDLLFNAQKLDEVINGAAESFVDRRGVERLTLTGALRLIGFEAPVAFASGLAITRSTQTVTNGGNTYHADPASLPFTTTGTFNGAQWRLVSNVTQADLTTYAIPRTGASDLTASFKTTGTWEATGFKLDTNALWSLVSSNPTWQADTGDTLGYNRTSNRWSMAVGGTERFYVTAADGPARATDAATDDGLPRKSQVQTMVNDAVADRVRVSLSASQSTTSGTAVDFTSIPAWAKRITVNLDSVSTNGSGVICLQLGTAAGLVATGYTSTGAGYSTGGGAATNGFSSYFAWADGGGATNLNSGQFVLTRLSGNTWIAASVGTKGLGVACSGAGRVVLPDVLDRIRLTNGGGDTFDSGSVSILIEG